MKIKVVSGFFLIMLVVTSCSSIIYAIRGPKYKGKFDLTSLPKELDTTSYYIRKHPSQDVYGYLKFNINGVFYGYISFGKKLQKSELDTMKPNKNFYIFIKGYLRWEIYHDSYNGYNLFKAKVYQDSIVEWQIGNKRATIETYNKMK